MTDGAPAYPWHPIEYDKRPDRMDRPPIKVSFSPEGVGSLTSLSWILNSFLGSIYRSYPLGSHRRTEAIELALDVVKQVKDQVSDEEKEEFTDFESIINLLINDMKRYH